jgi:hypothetical protein
VRVDDSSSRCVSNVRYICLPPTGDVRGVANVDMFMKVGEGQSIECPAGAVSFPPVYSASLTLCTPQSNHIGPGGRLEKSQSAVFATSPDSLVLSP